MSTPVDNLDDRVGASGATIRRLAEEIRTVIVGQDALIDRLLIGVLARGHVLVEGLPGLAKTLSIRTLADALAVEFSRVQFTPDLLPADLTGTLVYSQKDGSFTPRKGPIFAHLVLADEINRAPAKVQSALLEAMEEGQVTIGETSFELPDPFLVMATQNPIEQEGTFPLPEAQIDRFLLKLEVGYPERRQERRILERMGVAERPRARGVATVDELREARSVVDAIYVDDRVKDYLLDVVFATRDPAAAGLPELVPLLRHGASPRATLSLSAASKAHAFLRGRSYVTPEDVQEVGPDVLRHRLLLGYEADAEELTAGDLIRSIFDRIAVP